MPKVSVIIPLYNAASYIPDLKQLWDQTLQDFELILVDDCSTDDTWNKLQEFKAHNPERAIILARNEHNLGPGGTRNHGLNKSSGEYVIFLDGDDRYEPTLLEKMSKRLDDTHADLVCCGFQEQYGERTDTKLFSAELLAEIEHFNAAQGITAVSPFTQATMLFSLFPAPWNKMVRRDFLIQHDISFPDIMFGEDRCWVMQMVLKAQRIELIAEPLYHYVLHDNSLSLARNERFVAAFTAQLAFINQFLTKAQLLPKLQDAWYFHLWDTLFTQYNRLSPSPDSQRLLLIQTQAFCQAHQIPSTPESIPLLGRLGLYKVLPKGHSFLPLRTKLKEQYRVARLIKRFNELL